MPYSFNPFTGNFDNTPSTLKGDNAYSNLQSNSATWVDAFQTGTVYKANSASYATIDFTNNKFFPLTGGQITGNTRINGNVTIFGDLTSTGTQTFANTIFSTTSSLSVVHVGSGPAVWIGNNGSGDIASFYDMDQGVEVLHVGGANGDFPNVGVKTSSPNKDFTVNGEISATSDIWTTGRIMSGDQELASIFRPDIDKGLSVFNTVQTNSATNWNYQGTDLKDLSAGWVGGNEAFTNLVANSAAYLSAVDLSFLSVSANWNSVYNTVQSNSATSWNYQGTDLKGLSANWQNTYTNFSSNSASYATQNFVNSKFYPLTGGTISGSVSATGSGSFNNLFVSEQAAGDAVLYASDYKVGINTEAPNEALTVFGNISASGQLLVPEFVDIKTAVQSNSASWNYQGTDLKGLSANWQNTYTNFSANSASYATNSFVQSNFLPLSGGNVSGVFEAGVGSISLFVSANKVGVNTEQPNKALTVVGDISATGTIYGDGSNLLNGDNQSVNSWVFANSANAFFNSVSAISLSGTFYGDGSNLIGAALPGQLDVNTTVRANSGSWNYQGTDLKVLSANWQNTFTTVSANSAKWESVYSNVVSNSASYATIDFANNKFFALSGGTISGATRINGNVTIFGDLTSTGTQTFANTIFSTTSSLSVVHVGSGPAVWIGNNGTGDIASFYDMDQGVEVLHVGGANGDFPNVGVKTSSPNKDFTVKGEISATSDIWTSGRILSGGQELASIFQPDIAKGVSSYTTVLANSAEWEAVYTSYSSASASYVTSSYANSTFLPLSGGALSGSFTVNDQLTSAATLFISGGKVGIKTEAPNKDFTVNGEISSSNTIWSANGNSDQWNSAYSTVQSNSASWQTGYEYATAYSNASGSLVTYETGDVIKPRGAIVGSSSDSNSVDVSQTVLDIKSLVYGVQVTTSPDQVNFKTWNFNPDGSLTYPDNTSQTTAFTGIPSYVESTYSTVQSNSASWDYQGTDLKDLSANWQNTYTDFSTNSASYATSNFVQTNFLPLSGGSIQGNISTTGGMSVGDQLETASLYASGGKVGINTELPNKSLTVVGDISSTGTIYTNYLELSDVKFTNEYATNVNSVTASNDFLKVFVGSNIKYLRLYDVE